MKRDIFICEVGPRDGLQNAKHLMPTEAKKAWIRAMAEAGLEEIEVGSFVPPKLIPAMADTGEIVQFARTLPGVMVVALAPNLKGFQRALEAGAHKVTFPISASRQHSESNVRMTPDEIHKMGQEELRALQSEMDVILKGQGLTAGTVGARMLILVDNEKLTSGEDLAVKDAAPH